MSSARNAMGALESMQYGCILRQVALDFFCYFLHTGYFSTGPPLKMPFDIFQNLLLTGQHLANFFGFPGSKSQKKKIVVKKLLKQLRIVQPRLDTDRQTDEAYVMQVMIFRDKQTDVSN